MRHRVPKLLRHLGTVVAVSALVIAASAILVPRPGFTQQPAARFTIIQHPTVRADQYLLDTHTGQMWSPVQYTDVAGKPTVWRYIDRVDSYDELKAWLREKSN